jgi:ribonuclease T1
VGQAARLVLTQSLRKLGRAVITAGVATAALLPLQVVQAKQPDNGLASVQLAALPAEAQATERLVRAGGPFPYAKDGSVFGNRERLLPRKPRGHYREYTVGTPGSRNRGARRIVCGEPPTRPEACYYTDDHYASFRRIAP